MEVLVWYFIVKLIIAHYFTAFFLFHFIIGNVTFSTTWLPDLLLNNMVIRDFRYTWGHFMFSEMDKPYKTER